MGVTCAVLRKSHKEWLIIMVMKVHDYTYGIIEKNYIALFYASIKNTNLATDLKQF